MRKNRLLANANSVGAYAACICMAAVTACSCGTCGGNCECGTTIRQRVNNTQPTTSAMTINSTGAISENVMVL